jgi:hypothetical protein
MTYFIYARDGAGVVVLRRESEEAAQQRAAELRDLGWLDVNVVRKEEVVPSTRGESYISSGRPAAEQAC